MKVSYGWIKDYLNVKLNAIDCANVLTDTGLEVEGIQEIESKLSGSQVIDILSIPHTGKVIFGTTACAESIKCFKLLIDLLSAY